MRILTRTLGYALMCVVGVLCAGPFLWTLATSLKGTEDVFAFPPTFIPREPSLRNFTGVWEAIPFGAYVWNSLIVASVGTAANVLLASLAAYPLARMRFRGKAVVTTLILATMMVPEQVVMIPVYTLLMNLGLLNTLAGVILPSSVNAFGIFLMVQYYRSVPRELDEAAVMDGCGAFHVWWQILLPLSRPAIATLAAFTFVGLWSSFLWPLIVLRDSANYTLPVGLNALMSSFSSDYKYLAAGAVLSILPVLAVFLVMQRYFVRGVLTTGLKS